MGWELVIKNLYLLKNHFFATFLSRAKTIGVEESNNKKDAFKFESKRKSFKTLPNFFTLNNLILKIIKSIFLCCFRE